jgi:hypothetical protein
MKGFYLFLLSSFIKELVPSDRYFALKREKIKRMFPKELVLI